MATYPLCRLLRALPALAVSGEPDLQLVLVGV